MTNNCEVMRDDMTFIYELIVEKRQNSTYELIQHLVIRQFPYHYPMSPINTKSVQTKCSAQEESVLLVVLMMLLHPRSGVSRQKQ